MSESRDNRAYEAPRAVRLSDATTGTFTCVNGPSGTRDQCDSGFAVNPHNVCSTGSSVTGF